MSPVFGSTSAPPSDENALTRMSGFSTLHHFLRVIREDAIYAQDKLHSIEVFKDCPQPLRERLLDHLHELVKITFEVDDWLKEEVE